jgi:hypothetical protein
VTVASLDEQQRILVLTAAVEGLALLAKGLRRRGANCHLCDYSPDVVRFHFAHWRELKSATEGCSASGANPIGGGIRDRMKLAAILADLEAATDQALEPFIRWYAVSRIYKRQERFLTYLALRRVALLNLHHPEPSAPLAEAICLEAISRVLGWYPHDFCEGQD